MNHLTRLAATSAIATVVVIGGAGVALAQEDTPDRAAFVCANLDAIRALQADHAALIEDRLALLASARATAEESGNTKAVERIDARTARATERQAKVAARQEKLETYAAEHCPG